jgi:hypothetical protein
VAPQPVPGRVSAVDGPRTPPHDRRRRIKPTPPKTLADYLKDETKDKKSANDADKPWMIEVGRRLEKLGFSLVATAGDGSASIAFTAGANGGASITKYQVKVGSGAWTDVVGTSSPITITGLTNFQINRIRLRAVNAAGGGVASDPVQVWPRVTGSALNSLKAQSSSRVLASVSALYPVGGTVSHYWFTAYAKGTNTVVATCRAAADVRSCVFSGLVANTEYDVSARGFFTLTGSADVLQTLDSATQTVRTKN